jgi:hypothetical protein
VRLENDVLVTEEGPVDLLSDVPIEAAEIEALMQEQLHSRHISVNGPKRQQIRAGREAELVER